MPPHNLEAEKSVLGAVLLDERHLYALVADEQLRPEHFYREQHELVFAAMLKLHDRASRIDQLTVAEALRRDGQLEQVGGPGRSTSSPAGCRPPVTPAITGGSSATTR